MAKVHPNAAVAGGGPRRGSAAGGGGVEEQEQQKPPSTVLTVWRKSLLFNCEGFTVFDARGDLAFRVDCYGSHGHCRRRRAEDVVLMDAAGTPVLTVRRKKTIGLQAETWVVHDGDGSGTAKPLLSVRRHGAVGFLLPRRARAADEKAVVAHVTPLVVASMNEEPSSYVVEGSYGRRSCAVRDARGGGPSAAAAPVAEVRRKEAVGDDVFRLVVAADTRLGAALSMGVVIALDQMFGGGGRRWSAALH